VYSYFIRILTSFDELCYTRDCVIKIVMERIRLFFNEASSRAEARLRT
jgi:hypothetical protein